MKNISPLLLISFLVLLNSCVSEFMPKTEKDSNLLVVEGLITDKPEVYTIKLSRSLPLGSLNEAKPLLGALVTVTDDLGGSFDLSETATGVYTSDPAVFQGQVGRIYTLHVKTGSGNKNLNYESIPMELKPVPPIDSLYYEKISFPTGTGCQIYLDTHDPSNRCKYYRWEYIETWEFRLPYTVPNSICWISSNSDIINIKDASTLAENRVVKYPINLISNATDRLAQRYSILVNQYSLNEDEKLYWEKLQNISEQVGGLYDMIPSSIASNVFCINSPDENVLGYFSVAGRSSKRFFIKDHFENVFTPYTDRACIADTVFGPVNGPIQYLNTFAWVIISHPLPPPSYRVITRSHMCYDCTLRGTNVQPDFWISK
jgi:hypothetical protein